VSKQNNKTRRRPGMEVPDPYAEFLDLPKGARPPHYYDLLELELFSSDVERIVLAARRQFRKIKPYEDHPDVARRERIQDIMNQIATARAVLTDPARKEEYDQALAERLCIDRDRFLQSRVATPVPEFRLRVTAGPSFVGQRIDLVEGVPVRVGRDVHCDLHLPGIRVAEHHCAMHFEGGAWRMASVQEEVPLVVNGQLVTEWTLADGDAVDIGGYRLRCERVAVGKRGHSAFPAFLSVGVETRLEKQNVPFSAAGFPLSLSIHSGPSVPQGLMSVLPPEEIVIGSAWTALWQLPHSQVAGQHCRVLPVDDTWTVEDLGSETGTFVNGTQVSRRVLAHRDMLTIGPFDIQVSFRK